MNGVDNLRLALHPRILELIIFPTEKCNFRCTYCYEDFEIGKMKRPTVEGIKRLIDARIERNSLDILNLSWFGGEPTLASELMLEISDHALEHYKAGRLKQLTGAVTTNGYLLKRPLLEKLVERYQRSYQISLDGYGEGHDQTRKYASGKGTFNVIWENLLAARDTKLQFEILLRLHQTFSNEESTRELVDAIIREFAGDPRFNVFFKSVENLGGPNAAKIKKVDVQAVTQRVGELTTKLRAAGFGVSAVLDGPESNKGAFENAAQAPAVVGPAAPAQANLKSFDGYICYAAKPNSLAIRADGRVGKCTVLLNDDRNTIGHIKADGTIDIDNAMLKLWMRGFNSLDPIELGCPLQNLPKLATKNVKEVPLLKLSDLKAAVTA